VLSGAQAGLNWSNSAYRFKPSVVLRGLILANRRATHRD
jgi:hypothetical protein